MNKFGEETNIISSILSQLNIEFILESLNKYSDKDAIERTVLVLEDYFRSNDAPLQFRNSEIDIIKRLFPQYSRVYITNLFEAVGNEENRLRIITKLLINDKRNQARKRGLSPSESDNTCPKVLKTDADNVPVEQSPEVQGCSIESTSTIIYQPEEIVCESTVEVEEAHVPNPVYLCEPSTSGLTLANNYMLEEHYTDAELDEAVEAMNSIINDEAARKESAVVSVKTEAPEVSMTVDVLLQSVDTPAPKPRSKFDVEDDPIVLEDFCDDLIMEDDLLEEEEIDDETLLYPLMEMFPEACPTFLRTICKGKKNGSGVLDNLVSEILETNYPKRLKSKSPDRVLDANEQLQMMKSILVDADPDYLQMHCDRLIDEPNKLKDFIEKAIENHDYPTLKDFLRRQQLSAQQKQYTTEFSTEKFLEVIPNPFDYFRDPDRKTNPLDYQSFHYAFCYLRNKFNTMSMRTIRDVFKKNNQNFLKTCYELQQMPSSSRMKSKRAKTAMPEVINNIPLLQEIAFFEGQDKILVYLNEKKVKEDIERAQTKAAGLMQTCSCCFDDEVMPKDVFRCESGCVFCKSCVQKGVEVAFGDGKLDFKCLSNCPANFSLQILKAVLTPKLFSTIALKKQVQEVKAAGIEDLETCPFCDFVTIPARDDKLFRCLNPECMKESCRACKEPSHVPLRCDEVEKDRDVKTRTYIENKMTEALLRTCYKCGMKFIKEDGCNKMTCSCGALMCYVCGKPVKDYKHFNGLGGDKTELCPLYSDTNKLHRDAVLKGAEAAKTEMGISDSQLKINPTADIQQHYKVPATPQQHMVPRNPFEQLPQHEVLLQRRAMQLYEHNALHGRHRLNNRHFHRRRDY